MKQRSKLRVLSATALIVAILGQGALAAGGYGDIKNHWNEKNILKWKDSSIINGYQDGSFRPDNAITRAEFSAILNRVFKFSQSDTAALAFTDVTPNAWYADAVNRMQQAGILNGRGDGTFQPDAFITRQEAATVLSRAFEVSGADIDVLKTYADQETVDRWAAASMAGLVQDGYLQGSNNYLNAKSSLTRAELIALVEKVAGNVWNGTQASGTIEGNLVVNSDSAVLKDLVITGDLFLTQGIAAGNVTLDNVQVNGRLVVLGGGENSIHLRNSSVGKSMLVNDAQNRVRIVTEGSTQIAGVVLKSGATLQNKASAETFGALTIQGTGSGAAVQLAGRFGDVTITDQSPNVKLSSGTIQTLIVDKAVQKSNISLSSGSIVAVLRANAPAQITGNGTISQAVIDVPGVVSSILPKQVTLNGAASMTVGDRVVSESTGSTASTGNAGNSGNTGNSGGSDSAPVQNLPSYIETWKISTVGTVKYVSVVFKSGTKADYTYTIDGEDVTNDITNVTTEGTVVKYELKDGQNTLVIKSADGTAATLSLRA